MSIELEKAVVLRELEKKMGMMEQGFRGINKVWKKVAPHSYYNTIASETQEQVPLGTEQPEAEGKIQTPKAAQSKVKAAVVPKMPKTEVPKPPKVDVPKTPKAEAPPKPPKTPEYDKEVVGGLRNLGFKEADARSGASGLKGKTVEERMDEAIKRMPQKTTTHTTG